MVIDPRIPLIESLMAASGAEAGAHYTMTWDAENQLHRLYDMQPIGPARFVNAFMRFDGMTIGELLGNPEPARLGTALDSVTAVLRFQRQRLGEMPPTLSALWREAGITESVGTNVFVDEQYLGWIGVFSQHRLDPEALAPSLPAVVSGLQAAKAQNEPPLGGTDEAAIVDAQGRCLRASPKMTRWLAEPPVRADLLRLLARERGPESSLSGRVALAGRLVQVLHLRNDRAVIMFCPHDSPRLLMIRALTPRQRSIAARTAAGHSPEEIGEVVGLSAQAVRDQLMVIYKQLNITSRAELVSQVISFVS